MRLLFNNMRSLVLILIICIVILPLSAWTCTKEQRDATCADVVDTLKSSESAVVNALPKQRDNYIKLENWSVEICAAVTAADNLKAKTLIAAFLPVFDDIVGQLGVNKQWLALADIGIHIVLNHLPLNSAAMAARNGEPDTDAILISYRNRAVWGCQYKPEACKQ